MLRSVKNICKLSLKGLNQLFSFGRISYSEIFSTLSNQQSFLLLYLVKSGITCAIFKPFEHSITFPKISFFCTTSLVVFLFIVEDPASLCWQLRDSNELTFTETIKLTCKEAHINNIVYMSWVRSGAHFNISYTSFRHQSKKCLSF